MLMLLHSEKMYQIDDHIACAVAGITADANILIQNARVNAQRYALSHSHLHTCAVHVRTHKNQICTYLNHVDLHTLHTSRYLYAYQEPVPVEYLVQTLCDTKQGYTQYGGKYRCDAQHCTYM